ncbi:hypothetical protein IX83_02400 [Basilea psittacipulmonis DSM 24701]|uniref:Probable peptidoglycan glycosyltransferase FtsW n=1 Tax=Basilea psittacipulmonis DSM 24701 TaxID=1072685 RepID=A0A077DCJ4_9BURK|nr:hypothetical protein IX83_02400 [Basilea psittacipulmonis DSM 24701]
MNRSVQHRPFDLALLTILAIILIFGTVMVYSSSIALQDGRKFASYAVNYFFNRHILFIFAGLFMMGLVMLVPMEKWQKYAKLLYIVAAIGLVLVFIPHIGQQVNGASRWIRFFSFKLQPSEFMKFAMIIFVSHLTYLKMNDGTLNHLRKGVGIIVLYVGAAAGLIIREPDLGTTIVIISIVFIILVVANINKIYIILLMIAGSIFVVVMIYAYPWRWARILAYRDPFNPEYASSTSYQLLQSLIAIGRGGWFGEGLGSSVGKLHYLPEAHTDFIMAVVAEELGVVGVFFVMLLFILLLHRMFRIARRAFDNDLIFNGLVVHGIIAWIFVQFIVNLGVVSGLLPTKGLTMPFISYGGSSMVMLLMAMGLVIKVDCINRGLTRARKL